MLHFWCLSGERATGNTHHSRVIELRAVPAKQVVPGSADLKTHASVLILLSLQAQAGPGQA